jgi:hypothetical protein
VQYALKSVNSMRCLFKVALNTYTVLAADTTAWQVPAPGHPGKWDLKPSDDASDS